MAKLFRSTSLRFRPDHDERPGKHSRNQSALGGQSKFDDARVGVLKLTYSTKPDPYARPSTSLDRYSRTPSRPGNRSESRLETTTEETWRFPKNTPTTWTAPRKAPEVKPARITSTGAETTWHFAKHTPTASTTSTERTPSPQPPQRAPKPNVGPLNSNPVELPVEIRPSSSQLVQPLQVAQPVLSVQSIQPVQPRPIQTTVNRKRQDSLFSPSSGNSPSNVPPSQAQPEIKEASNEPFSFAGLKPKLSRWRSIGGLFGKKTLTPPVETRVLGHQRSATALGMSSNRSWMNLSGRTSVLDMRPITPQSSLLVENDNLKSEATRAEMRRAIAAPFSEYCGTPSPQPPQASAYDWPAAIQQTEPAELIGDLVYYYGNNSEDESMHEATDHDYGDAESIDVQTFSEVPVLKVDIPSINFERYSVMFNGIIPARQQSLLERRQVGGERSNRLTRLDTTNLAPQHRSRSHRRAASSPAAAAAPSKPVRPHPPRSSSRPSSEHSKPELITNRPRPRPRRQRSNTSLSKASLYAHATLDLVLESEEPLPEKEAIKRQRSRSSVNTGSGSVSRPNSPDRDSCSPLSLIQYTGTSADGKIPDGWVQNPVPRSTAAAPAAGKGRKKLSPLARISPATAGLTSENLALALQHTLNSPTDTIASEDWHFGGQVQVARSLSVTRAVGLQKKRSGGSAVVQQGGQRTDAARRGISASSGTEKKQKKEGERIIRGKAQTPVVRGSSGRRHRKSVKVCIEEA